MRVYAVLGLGFALFAADIPLARAEDAAKDCKLRRVAAFDVTRDRGGRPQIPVTIAGKTVTLLVDTGSLFTAVTEATRKDLDLQRVVLPYRLIQMFDGTGISAGAVGKGFMLGRLPVPNYSFMVLPDSELSNGGGLLGGDVLSVFDLDIDFPSDKLNLMEPNKCGDGAVYWTSAYAKVPITFGDTAGDTDAQVTSNASTGSYSVRAAAGPVIEDKHIYAKGKLDGVDVKFVIDTGSSASAMTLQQAKHIFGWSSDQPGLTRVNADQKDAQPIYSYPFKTLSLGDLSVNNPKIYIHAVRPGEISSREDIILGMDVLKFLHIYVAYKDGVMYASAGEAKPPPAPKPN